MAGPTCRTQELAEQAEETFEAQNVAVEKHGLELPWQCLIYPLVN